MFRCGHPRREMRCFGGALQTFFGGTTPRGLRWCCCTTCQCVRVEHCAADVGLGGVLRRALLPGPALACSAGLPTARSSCAGRCSRRASGAIGTRGCASGAPPGRALPCGRSCPPAPPRCNPSPSIAPRAVVHHSRSCPLPLNHPIPSHTTITPTHTIAPPHPPLPIPGTPAAAPPASWSPSSAPSPPRCA